MALVSPHTSTRSRRDHMAPAVERRTILIVDDEEGVRSLLGRWLESSGFRVLLATGADAALAVFDEDPPALVVCDIRMPGRDGLWLAARVRQDFPDTAVIISSGVQDCHAAEECLRHGVIEYLTKPYGRDRLRDAVRRGLEWHEAASEAQRWKRLLEGELRERKSGLTRVVRGLAIHGEQDLETLLTVALGQREAVAHAHRVQVLAVATARRLELAPDIVAVLSRAALVHDIGKAALPIALVRKPASLTDEELALMRTYPAVGAALLAEIPFLKDTAAVVRDAHERMDGHGFPHSIRAASVGVAARILGVVDAFDAMTHPRVFRDAISTTHALLEIDRCTGTQFDPLVVDAFHAVAGRV